MTTHPDKADRMSAETPMTVERLRSVLVAAKAKKPVYRHRTDPNPNPISHYEGLNDSEMAAIFRASFDVLCWAADEIDRLRHPAAQTDEDQKTLFGLLDIACTSAELSLEEAQRLNEGMRALSARCAAMEGERDELSKSLELTEGDLFRARAKALEDAAQVCDGKPIGDCVHVKWPGFNPVHAEDGLAQFARSLAQQIRSLASNTEGRCNG